MKKGDLDEQLLNDSISEQLSDEVSNEETIVINQLMGAAEEIRNAPKKRIMIHNQEGPAGNQPVFVSVNGMGYSIPREVPTLVPEPIIEALKNAAEVKYYREMVDNQQFGPILERTVHRFPFSEL